jgi:pimeloyl-ACP methyl ester carboxylesterase
MQSMAQPSRPLLLIHGWGDASALYQPLLAGGWHRKVVCPDLPGFGSEPPPSRIWTGDDFSQWLSTWIDHNLGDQPIDIAAHSFGGRLAVRLAVSRPQTVGRLVLAAPAGLPRTTPAPPLDDHSLMAQSFDLIRREDLTDLISRIKQPTLLLWGDSDDIVPTRRAQEWVAMLKHCESEMWPGGHWAHLHDPQRLISRIEAFLDD